MFRTVCGFSAALLTALAVSALHAQPMRPSVPYHERVEISALAPTGVSISALGRQFDLVLEPNDELLRRLGADQRKAAAGIELWKGSLEGVPSSWVRLTRRRGVLSGAISDGVHLFIVEPYPVGTPAVRSRESTGVHDSVVYVATDAYPALGDLAIRRDGEQSTAAEGSSTLNTALLSALALSPMVEVDVGLVADSEFARFGSDAMAELLSVANIVDGIFRRQLGVHLRVAEVAVLDAQTDPFTATEPSALLNQLEQFKHGNVAFRPLGLAHLLVGRELQETGDREIVGVANIGSLCQSSGGVSLTQGTFGTGMSALIAAHEIGHNFGAPHDAEPGSVCAATPRGFLMDANVSDSDQFSQCSIDQMRALVDAATCVRPLSASDASLISTGTRAEIPVGRPFISSFLLENVGTGDLFDIEVVVETSSGAVLDQGELPNSPDPDGLRCGRESQTMICTLGVLRKGQKISIGVQPTAVQPGTVTTTATLTAQNDADSTNNTASYSIDATPAVKLRVLDIEKSTEIARPGVPFRLVMGIVNEGILDATDVTMDLSLPRFLDLAAATLPHGGTCSKSLVNISCPIGSMSIGQPFEVVFDFDVLDRDLRLGFTSSDSFRARLVAREPDANENRSAEMFLEATPVWADTALTVERPAPGVFLEQNAFSFEMRNLGPDSIPSMRLSFSNLGLVIDNVQAPGAQCSVDSTSHQVVCHVALVAAGETRTVTIAGLAPRTGAYETSYSLLVDAYGTADGVYSDRYDWAVLTQAAPPPPPPPPAPAPPAQSGGGGGGGAFDPLSLFFAWAAAARALRRRRGETHTAGCQSRVAERNR